MAPSMTLDPQTLGFGGGRWSKVSWTQRIITFLRMTTVATVLLIAFAIFTVRAQRFKLVWDVAMGVLVELGGLRFRRSSLVRARILESRDFGFTVLAAYEL